MVLLHPAAIANDLNNYFSSNASQTKVNIKYSHKHFSDFPKNRAQNYFSLSPTNKDEVALIKCSLILLNQLGLTVHLIKY